MSEHQIQTWETEDPVLVIFGTHHINEGFAVAKKFYEDTTGEIPEGLYQAIASAYLHGGRRWAADGVLQIEEDRWPSDMVSSTLMDGWTPFLVVEW